MDISIVLKALQWLIVAGFTTSFLYGFYNAYLHPLSRYPGPKLWAAYRLPYVVYNIRGQLPFKVLEFHRKYGPVVRIAPNELAFTQAEAWNDIYGLQKGRLQNQRDRASYAPPADGDFGDGLLDAGDVGHARLRRIFGQAFTPKALDAMSGMLAKYSDLLIEQLKLAIKKNPVQDVSAWYNYTTFDLTGEFAFGQAFHCLEKGGESHFFMDTVLAGVVAGCRIWQLQRYGLLTLLEPFFPKSVMEQQHKMAKYTKDIIDERMKEGFQPNKADVMNYLMENKKKEDELSLGELYENALTLVVAGSETTATELAGITSLLGRNPEVLLKVQREVRSAFKDSSEITPSSVNDLTYMLAVISEAMRLFPASPWGFPRIIGTKGGQSIAGHWVPEGTRCDIFHHAAYRYEGNFSRPLEFIPERFLTESAAKFKQDKKEVIQPFSFGPRGCIGKNLAYSEMRLILAKMLWHFDFELDDPTVEWHETLRGFLIWERTPMQVRLKPVKR